MIENHIKLRIYCENNPRLGLLLFFTFVFPSFIQLLPIGPGRASSLGLAIEAVSGVQPGPRAKQVFLHAAQISCDTNFNYN